LFLVIVIRGEDAELVSVVRSGFYSWGADLVLVGCVICVDIFVKMDILLIWVFNEKYVSLPST